MAPGGGAGSVVLRASSMLPVEARGKEPMVPGSRAEPGQAQPRVRSYHPQLLLREPLGSRLRILHPLVGDSPGRGDMARSGQSLSDLLQGKWLIELPH